MIFALISETAVGVPTSILSLMAIHDSSPQNGEVWSTEMTTVTWKSKYFNFVRKLVVKQKQICSIPKIISVQMHYCLKS